MSHNYKFWIFTTDCVYRRHPNDILFNSAYFPVYSRFSEREDHFWYKSYFGQNPRTPSNFKKVRKRKSVNNLLKWIFLMTGVDSSDYLYAALGGLLLGIATSINYMFRGKVTGMSGIVYSLVSCTKSKWAFTQNSSPKSLRSWAVCCLCRGCSLTYSGTLMMGSLTRGSCPSGPNP